MLLFFLILIAMTLASFTGLVVDRLPLGLSIITGRSRCDHCQSRLRPFELIPLFSFLIQGGYCRHCKAKLSWLYPTLEVLFSLLFILAYYQLLDLPESLILIASLLLSILDFRHQEIPFSLWLFFALLITAINGFSLSQVLWLSFALIAFFWDLKIGPGDFLWLFLIAGDIPLLKQVKILEIASISGILYYIILKKKGAIPFIPFLSIGYLGLLIWEKIPSL
ncbi:prepilin peptidase [Lactococcus termiticola]|uniref:Prepilin peptidase n=1 Tax=Lactococcus termiticola TaxID=2169526 RepID=A0A2R5HDF3_9LACT|nr:A24 family peptidase [Lactococcus termiticola]GBG96052.1 prepilin peptidase [Lactococcus termiticola]